MEAEILRKVSRSLENSDHKSIVQLRLEWGIPAFTTQGCRKLPKAWWASSTMGAQSAPLWLR